MAASRETRLTLSGLVTQPSKYLTEPGTLAQAVNVMCRQEGVLEARLAFTSIANLGAVSGRAPRVIAPLGDKEAIVFLDTDARAEWNEGLRTAYWVGQTPAEIAAVASDPTWNSRGFAARSRNRYIMDSVPNNIGSIDCVRVCDAEHDTTARLGGMVPPSIVEVASGSAGDAVEANSYVGYRAHFERVHSDGYVQTGPISPQTVYFNGSTAMQAALTIRWAKSLAYASWVQAGDFLKIYRTVNQTTSAVGDVHLLTATIKLTSTDISNGYATTTDVTEDEGLGEFLYTNSGQSTIDASKWYPPSANDICTFRGVTWYATPYTPLAYSVRVPGDWGGHASGVATNRAVGIGTFTITGDTNSNTTINNISATDIVGLAVGQRMVAATSGFTPGSATITITALGPTSITVSTGASTTSPGETFTFCDRIEIEGVTYDTQSPGHLAHNMAAGAGTAAEQCWLFFDRAVEYSASTHIVTGSSGIRMDLITPSWGGSRTISLRGTNGSRYSPPIPEIGSTAETFGSDDPRTNRAHFSDIQEPESVPRLNYRFFGERRLLRFTALEDIMIAWCTDGAYAVVGDGKDWDIRPFDLALKLMHRNAVGIMDGAIWALTNRGLVVIQGASAAQEVSGPFIGNDIRLRWLEFFDWAGDPASINFGTQYAYNIMLACDELHKEVWIRYRDEDALVGASYTYVFNVETKTWTTVSSSTEAPTAMAYHPYQKSILLGQNADGTAALIKASYEDGDTTPSRRMADAVVQLNPFTGGDLNSRKQFIEAIWDLEILAAGQNLEVTPFFGSTTYTAYDLASPSGEIEHKVTVPRAAANGKDLMPGITFSGANADSDAAPWRLRGVTIKYRVASGDTRRT